MFESQQRHCVVSLSKTINPSSVLVQPRKTGPFITERLLMGRKESNKTKQVSLVINVTVNHISVVHGVLKDVEKKILRSIKGLL